MLNSEDNILIAGGKWLGPMCLMLQGVAAASMGPGQVLPFTPRVPKAVRRDSIGHFCGESTEKIYAKCRTNARKMLARSRVDLQSSLFQWVPWSSLNSLPFKPRVFEATRETERVISVAMRSQARTLLLYVVYRYLGFCSIYKRHG